MRLLERQLKQARIRLLDAPFVRVEQMVEPMRELQPVEQVAQSPIGVRDHHQPQPARP